MTPFVLSLLVKVTLLLAFGLIAAAGLRGFGPSLRHQLLLGTLGSCLLLPVLIVLAPRWEVRILPSAPAANVASIALSSPVPKSGARFSASTDQPRAIAANPSYSSLQWVQRRSLPVAWAFGFLAVLGWLAAGRIRLRRIASGSWPLTGTDWETTLEEESREAGVTKPVRLLSSSDISTPLTWGSRAPIILLPEDALEWPEVHRRIVLRHELAHVARGDAFSQLVAGFVCALYWFHPLVWITERRLRAECERACDDRVVSFGTPAPEYAAHLLEVARSARSFGAPGFLSVAMARPSQLEGRLLAVLNESGRRGNPSRGVRVVALVAALFIVGTVSAFRAVPRIAAGANEPGGVKTANVAEPKRVSADLPVINTNAQPLAANTNAQSQSLAVNTRASALDSIFQRSAPARDGGTLSLDLITGGQVNITGWDKQQVQVVAALGGRDWRDTHVTFTPADGGMRLATEYTRHSNSQSTSHNFDIYVPKRFNVQIKSSGGGVTIVGVDGNFTGHTGGGEIKIRNASGQADIRTGGGDIWVSDSRLTGSVSTGGGQVLVERVTGNFSGYSGSGPVSYINSDGGIKSKSGNRGIGSASSASSATNEATYVVVDGVPIGIGSGRGPGSKRGSTTTTTTYVDDGAGKSGSFGAGGIRMNSSGGDISLPAAPNGARVRTGGGAVRIGPSAGEVYASTGGGPIEIGPASGSVEAHTGAGNVSITLTGSGPHSVDVSSGLGQVELIVPPDLSATLELESAYTNNFAHETHIESDWPLSITSTKDWDSRDGTPRKYVRVRQTIGRGGPVISVRTV
ncbi:MAG TPA: M56 family metallopeptidase, partial [Gemmatimonadaceae bacterium]|nr:M56 family metallopeptidase [Gemmatimonadaceae bacterium]